MQALALDLQALPRWRHCAGSADQRSAIAPTTAAIRLRVLIGFRSAPRAVAQAEQRPEAIRAQTLPAIRINRIRR
jgi:hypothetical protein